MKTKIALLIAAMLISFGAMAEFDGVPADINPSISQPLATNGLCTGAGGKISYAQNDFIGDSTISTSHVDVPGMSRVITIGGTATTCIAVQYSAFVFAPNSELMFVQATVDGFPCLPGEVQFEGNSGTWATSRAFNFVCPSVSPGAHTVKMQYRSNGGNIVFTHKRSMIINHK